MSVSWKRGSEEAEKIQLIFHVCTVHLLCVLVVNILLRTVYNSVEMPGVVCCAC